MDFQGHLIWLDLTLGMGFTQREGYMVMEMVQLTYIHLLVMQARRLRFKGLIHWMPLLFGW